jgi:hypothetical protein
MTHETHDPRSVQDVTFALAQGRIADLRASAPAARDAKIDTVGSAEDPMSRGIIARGRDAIGRRLISLGGSVVADESLRRRALHR